MKRYTIAAVLMLIHGGLMEIGGAFALIPVLLSDGKAFDIGQYFSFIVPYFQENLPLMLVMGAIYGAVRVTGAVALLKKRMWGLALSFINCLLTMALMLFMLPAGILDGLFASSAMILLLSAFFKGKRIGG